MDQDTATTTAQPPAARAASAAPDDPRERYFWRNLIACIVVESLWGFACALVATSTIMTVFLQRLGATKTIIGAYPGTLLLAIAVLQIPAARWTGRLKRRLPAYFTAHLIPCCGWFAIAWFAREWGETHPYRLIWVIFLLNGLYALLLGTILPVWVEISNRLFPDRRRGLAYGLMTMGIGLCGSLGAWYAERTLDGVPFPDNFSRIFLVAAITMIAGLLPYLACKETVPAASDEPPARERFGDWLWGRLAADRRLRHFVVSRYLFEIGAAAGVFYAVYAIDQFHMSVGAAGAFTLVMSLARGVFSPIVGRTGDRRGYRRVISWGMFFAAASTAVALFATTGQWFYVVFVFQAILLNGDVIGVQNMIIEMSPEEDKTPYSAIFNTVMIPARFAAPLIAGIVADRWSIPLVFEIGLVLEVLGLLYMLAFVDDPRRPGQRILAASVIRFTPPEPWQ